MMIRNVDHMVGLVGPAHVGVGFDFADEDDEDYVYYGYDTRWIPQPPWLWPTGIEGHAQASNFATALRQRGYGEEEVRGILGENFLRVFERVWGG